MGNRAVAGVDVLIAMSRVTECNSILLYTVNISQQDNQRINQMRKVATNDEWLEIVLVMVFWEEIIQS